MKAVAFVDPAGGSGSDSMTLAIAHGERRGEQTIVVLDLVREARPPFSPEAAVAEFAEVLKAFGLSRLAGDRYAGEWPREAFRKHGIEYEVSALTKSELYRELLPLLNSGRVELLDSPRLLAQLGALERRTGRGGKDSIDHGPGPHAHDDLANACAAACVLAEQAGTTRKFGAPIGVEPDALYDVDIGGSSVSHGGVPVRDYDDSNDDYWRGYDD